MAINTTALGLTIWNSATDKYNYQQLADNWYKVDGHDHTPGKGKLIGTNAIAAGAITLEKIAPGVVSTQAKSVGTDAIVNRAITTEKIADGAVNYSKLDPNSRMPIGSIVPWWHPTPTTATLEALFGSDPGWAICNGERLAAGKHDFGNYDFTLPNLEAKFVMGAVSPGDSVSIQVLNFNIVSASEGNKIFTLNSSVGLVVNTTYSIVAPTVFGPNTTFTTGPTLSLTNQYVADNFAKTDVSLPGVGATISNGEVDRFGASGGQNTLSLTHSHTHDHTHQVPAHYHGITNAKTENTNHQHKNANRFVVISDAKSRSNSNYATKTGAAQRYSTDSFSGPMEAISSTQPLPSGNQWGVTGQAGYSAGSNGDVEFTTAGLSEINNKTSSELFDTDNRPAYVAITYIIKVKN